MLGVWLITCFQLSSVFLFLVYLAYKYSTYHYDHWKKLSVPHTDPTPLFGHLLDTIMGRQPMVTFLQSLYNRFENNRYFGFYEARNPVLVVRDPELVNTILVKDFGSFYDRAMDKVSFEHDELFDHLVNLRGEKWKTIRSKLTPTFTAAKLKSMLGDINICSSRLMDSLAEQTTNNNGTVNVSEIAAKFTTDTIGRCAFGLDCNTLSDPDSEFRRAGRDSLKPTTRTVILNFIRIVGLGRLLDVFRVRGMPNHVYDFFFGLLKGTMEQRETEKNIRNDFVVLLVKLRDEESLKNGSEEKIFTNEILAANAFVFFVAGFETTATTISYCLYELALNPDIQDQLREQIKETLNTNNGQLSYDTLKDMKYLDMVINETFRMHPPAPFLVRACTKKYEIPNSDLVLSPGAKVLIPSYCLHYDSKYYPNPNKFDPQRFTDENKASRPHGTFLPFGDGPRICIGMRFAMMEAKIGLANILSKYQVSPCKETQIPIELNPKSMLLLTPKHQITLSFKQIN